MISLSCVECSKTFQVKPYRKNTARYCSWDCSASSPTRISKTAKKLKGRCVNPRTAFKKGHRQSAEARRKMRLAKIGFVPWNKKEPVFITCRNCRRELQVQPCHSDQKYCSKVCAAKGRDKGKTTANFRLRTSKRYAGWRKAVFARDNFTCLDCGIRGGALNADHVFPFAHFPELRLEIENGRTLCEDCHRKTSSFGQKGRDFKEFDFCPTFLIA